MPIYLYFRESPAFPRFLSLALVFHNSYAAVDGLVIHVVAEPGQKHDHGQAGRRCVKDEPRARLRRGGQLSLRLEPEIGQLRRKVDKNAEHWAEEHKPKAEAENPRHAEKP